MGMRYVWKDVNGKRVAEQEPVARREAKPAPKKPKADKPAEEPKAE